MLGGEYKSKAFDLMLKEQGICILQSALHTPQQHGHAEQFMCTVMDKSSGKTLPWKSLVIVRNISILPAILEYNICYFLYF